MAKFTPVLVTTLKLMSIAAGLAGLVLAGLWFPNRPTKDLQGIWQTDGYGLAVEVTPFKLKFYEITPVSCALSLSFPAHMGMAKRFAGYEFAVAGDDLHIDVADLVNDITAHRLTSLPETCLNGHPATAYDIFEAFWQNFEQHYPSFETYNVDWQERHAEALAYLDAAGKKDGEISPKTLDNAIAYALHGLEDANIYFLSPSGDFSPHITEVWHKNARDHWMITDEMLTEKAAFVDTAGIRHGWLEGGIAFMAFHHMETTPTLGQQQVSEAQNAIIELAKTYQSARAIVVDNRYNAGGSDEVALTYAGLFSTDTRMIGHKKSQISPDIFTKETEVSAPGFEQAFTAPVILMNSSETTGAAEVFAAALRDLEHVTLLGENTSGAMSDKMTRNLSNDWIIVLPNQIFTDTSGKSFVGDGIPADIRLNYDQEGFENGQDTQLIQAIQHLNGDH